MDWTPYIYGTLAAVAYYLFPLFLYKCAKALRLGWLRAQEHFAAKQS